MGPDLRVEGDRVRRARAAKGKGASFSATPGFQELVCVCPMSVTDFGDFYGAHSRRPHPVFPLLAFQLGFSGIPEIHEKTEKSP